MQTRIMVHGPHAVRAALVKAVDASDPESALAKDGAARAQLLLGRLQKEAEQGMEVETGPGKGEGEGKGKGKGKGAGPPTPFGAFAGGFGS